MALAPGLLIAGRYLLERHIGHGSWGDVWLATHTTLGIQVALKALQPDKTALPDATRRLRREAQLLTRIHSAFVARVLDLVELEDGELMLVLEYIDGESLADEMSRGVMSIERAIAVGLDVLRGLRDLHGCMVVHRDIKPANVLFRTIAPGVRRATIIDFSLSCLERSRKSPHEASLTQLTDSDVLLGTVPYVAPEQVLNPREASEASDVYSLGAMLYRAVQGRHAFAADTDLEVAQMKLLKEAPRLVSGRSDPCAQAFEAIVARAMRRMPGQRYPTAHAMLTDLAQLATEPVAEPSRRPSSLPPPISIPTPLGFSRPGPFSRKEARAAWIGGMFALAGAVAFLFAVGMRVGSRAPLPQDTLERAGRSLDTLLHTPDGESPPFDLDQP